MELMIGGKKYVLEYTFEAVLDGECAKKVIDLSGGMAQANSDKNTENMVREITSMPKTVVYLFYAGLLEKNPVKSVDEAKELLKQYFKENKGVSDANFYGMASRIIGQMEEDGFFVELGIAAETVETPEMEPKIPQDHKKTVRSKVSTT